MGGRGVCHVVTCMRPGLSISRGSNFRHPQYSFGGDLEAEGTWA